MPKLEATTIERAPFELLAQELIIESIRLRVGPPGPWNPIRADAYREVAGKIQKIMEVVDAQT